MNRKPVDIIFPEAKADKEKGLCPICYNPVGKFKDKLSEQEFHISGLCQKCQDSVFG